VPTVKIGLQWLDDRRWRAYALAIPAIVVGLTTCRAYISSRSNAVDVSAGFE
jgi:hypothetical protein